MKKVNLPWTGQHILVFEDFRGDKFVSFPSGAVWDYDGWRGSRLLRLTYNGSLAPSNLDSMSESLGKALVEYKEELGGRKETFKESYYEQVTVEVNHDKVEKLPDVTYEECCWLCNGSGKVTVYASSTNQQLGMPWRNENVY